MAKPFEIVPFEIVVAGGGTAGWMTAAALGRFLGPGYRVRLVESDAIGTVGVGEATIPQILLFNRGLGIDEGAFLKATGGTFKLGIEFVGWTREGERYMHAFGTVGRDIGLVPFHHYWARARAAGVAAPLGAYAPNAVAARGGRMRRAAPAPSVSGGGEPPMPHAYHFDASLYAGFLRRFAEARGVERIEGNILSVERGENGDVAALLLDGERRVAGDLFIDCTGFRGLLIGETLGTQYEAWSRWLPCDRALAVPSEPQAVPEPYTRATAKAAGWQWRIPLQHRTGNGMVYCSDFISDDAAAASLMAGLDTPALGEPRPLHFTTGRRQRCWVGNVVAIGLSSGFLEPLESTSIHLIQSAIARLLKLLPGRTTSAIERAEYNRQADIEIERIRDFLILHYHANARPEPFWQACREMALPDTLAAKIDLFRARGTIVREQDELFTEPGWLQVFAGQGIDAAAWHPLADALPADDLAGFMAMLADRNARAAAAMPRHADVLASVQTGVQTGLPARAGA